MFSDFFANGSGIFTTSCCIRSSCQIECHRRRIVRNPMAKVKQTNTMPWCISPICTLKLPHITRPFLQPRTQSLIILFVHAIHSKFYQRSKNLQINGVCVAYLALPETLFEHVICCKGTVLFNATRIKNDKDILWNPVTFNLLVRLFCRDFTL